jgi:hypothetical protein
MHPFRIAMLLCESFREGGKVRTRTLPGSDIQVMLAGNGASATH